MPRKKKRERYTCPDPPCIHVILDEKKRLLKVFVEDYDRIIPIPVEELSKACNKLGEALYVEPREAYGEEVDYLARKYLEAEPIE